MTKNRLEAFSDGVIAIIITIMVLEIKIPHHATFDDLSSLAPKFFSYLLSFIFVGIYWNNHHHLIHAAEKINARIMWANLHLLFWLSLIPFGTAWMGENYFAQDTVVFYDAIMIGSGLAYYLLSLSLISHHGKDSKIAKAIGNDIKGKLSLGLYLIALLTAYYNTAISILVVIVVALIWVIPDTRIAKKI